MNENAENTCATAASREAMEKVCRFLKDTGTTALQHRTASSREYVRSARFISLTANCIFKRAERRMFQNSLQRIPSLSFVRLKQKRVNGLG